MHYVVVFMTGFMFSQPVFAVDYLAEGGLHFGGDTIVTVNKDNGSSDSLRAGEELSIAFGVISPSSKSFDTVLTFGMKKEVVYPDDGAITFTRYPLNALLLYKMNKLHVGGGLTYHFNPVYKVDTATQQETMSFRNAIGLLVDARYFILDGIYIGSRYTHIDYEVENDPAGRTYSGNSLGFLIAVQF